MCARDCVCFLKQTVASIVYKLPNSPSKTAWENLGTSNVWPPPYLGPHGYIFPAAGVRAGPHSALAAAAGAHVINIDHRTGRRRHTLADELTANQGQTVHHHQPCTNCRLQQLLVSASHVPAGRAADLSHRQVNE